MMWRRQLAQGAGMRSRKPSTAAAHCCAVSHASSRPSPWVCRRRSAVQAGASFPGSSAPCITGFRADARDIR